MNFFSLASQTNLATENWNPSPLMKSCPFWPDSPKETNRPPKETATPVSKHFSITSATPSILRSKIHATRWFWEKYSGPVVLSNGKSSKKTQFVNLRPHDLRRHAATHASRSGTPIEIVSKVILRHAHLATTQRYLGTVTDVEAIRWIENLYA